MRRAKGAIYCGPDKWFEFVLASAIVASDLRLLGMRCDRLRRKRCIGREPAINAGLHALNGSPMTITRAEGHDQ